MENTTANLAMPQNMAFFEHTLNASIESEIAKRRWPIAEKEGREEDSMLLLKMQALAEIKADDAWDIFNGQYYKN